MYHLATARVCVLDSYSIALSILPHQDDLFALQMWHALGAIKQFGYQAIGQPGGRNETVARAMHMHRNYDVVTCGGPGSIHAFAAAFDVDPATVVPLGLPRVDYLRAASEQRAASGATPALADLVARFPRLADSSKPVVLYAPTFRWHRKSAYRQVVEAFASAGVTLVVKPHDLESATVSGPHVVDATGVDILDLLPACDVVITDYSAVAFEAACIQKPVHFYVYDIEEYRSAQGLNFDPLVEMPGESTTDLAELVGRVTSLDYNAEVAEAFRQRFVPPAGAACTANIADLLLSHLRGVK